MIAVLQRVSEASVHVNKIEISRISSGLLVLLGIEEADTEEDIAWLAKKILSMRIFDDEAGVMNRSIIDTKGELLVVSQFTLHASTKKGNRPSYIKAAKPGTAIPRYEKFIAYIKKEGDLPVKTGEFGADMKVSLINDGPVTIIIDSKDKK